MTGRRIELYVPAITPFDADLAVDTAAFVAHARNLLAAGAHGLAPFGTTGEATSLSLRERRAALEALVEAGIPAARMIPGNGCCALPDSIELARHAAGLGCRGVLMLPPFYYKNVPEEGLYRAYSQVLDAVPDLRVYLYHIPQMSGVPITLALIERLLRAHGDRIAGLKDSSGDWENTAAILREFPQIDTYSASEALIPRNAAAGGAGCISASANVNPRGIRALIDALDGAKDGAKDAPGTGPLHDQVSAVRGLFEGVPLIPAIKAAVAAQWQAPGLARVRPPFVGLGPDHAASIDRAVALAGPQGAA